jgi:hypothetical protein
MIGRLIAGLLITLATASAVLAADNPFLGSWRVSGAKVAPWYDNEADDPVFDPELKDKTIVFGATSASGSRVVDCPKVIYSVSTIPPDFLFEGA